MLTEILAGIGAVILLLLGTWTAGKRKGKREAEVAAVENDKQNAEKVKQHAAKVKDEINVSWEGMHGYDVRPSAIEQLQQSGRLRD